jgi:hypothetical protein
MTNETTASPKRTKKDILDNLKSVLFRFKNLELHQGWASCIIHLHSLSIPLFDDLIELASLDEVKTEIKNAAPELTWAITIDDIAREKKLRSTEIFMYLLSKGQTDLHLSKMLTTNQLRLIKDKFGSIPSLEADHPQWERYKTPLEVESDLVKDLRRQISDHEKRYTNLLSSVSRLWELIPMEFRKTLPANEEVDIEKAMRLFLARHYTDAFHDGMERAVDELKSVIERRKNET